MIFDESLRFNLKISALNHFLKVSTGNIGDFLDFDFFRLASLNIWFREYTVLNFLQMCNSMKSPWKGCFLRPLHPYGNSNYASCISLSFLALEDPAGNFNPFFGGRGVGSMDIFWNCTILFYCEHSRTCIVATHVL